MKNLTRNGILALGAAMLLTAGTADAQATKESLKCASGKLKLYGKDLASQLKCISKAAAAGVPVDALCISKVVDKTAAGFAKIELKGGCATDASTAPIDDGTLANTRLRLDAYLTATATALVPNPLVGNKCQASKLNAVGKLVSALFGCESKAADKNIPVDQVKCVQKNVDKMVATFSKAELKPPCDTTGDATTQVGEAQDVTRLQTVYTPRFNGCGNNLTLAPETCDDGNSNNFDNCPSDCTTDFCSPIVGSTRTVVLVTNRPDLSAVTVDLDYPEGKVNLPGIGGDIPAGIVNVAFGSGQTNDFDHALRHVQFDAFDFGSQNIATFAFEDCTGAVAPTPADFTCSVADAGQEDGLGGFKSVTGVTCSVTVLP
jgi:hypothetical protein